MRAYFFGNMYLSPIQQGIQAAHTTHELFLRYPTYNPNYEDLDSRSDVLHEWAKNHKTMILLNGGYGENLHNLVRFFATPANPFPWAKFHEGEDALDGALTCVGIVLPPKIYELSSVLRSSDGRDVLEDITLTGKRYPTLEEDEDGVAHMDPVDISKFELQLAQELTKYSLAS